VRVLRSHSLPLGVEQTLSPCRTSKITLEAGDILVVPTDGAEEAMSGDGRQFGRERIFDLVRNNRDKPAVEIVETLFRGARDFAEGRRQEDDITAVVVKVLPSASARTLDQPEGSG
jgi:sigma-B regulation protein RsbU (phosphoserine phosphatase)